MRKFADASRRSLGNAAAPPMVLNTMYHCVPNTISTLSQMFGLRWKDQTVAAHGVGAYIAEATDKGDFPKIVLGVAMMSIFVTLFNRLFWRQLYAIAERRLRL